MATEQKNGTKWLDLLSEEDLAFIKRFVLASGSLKEIAEIYGITYPTVRLRLDRLIEKIKVLDSHQPMSQFERLIRSLYAEGRVDINTLKTLLGAHKNEMEAQNEASDSTG
jgi:hypothetical protein